MAKSTIKLTYYNGLMWHTLLLPHGTRAVWPARLEGPLPGAATRYYHRPARVERRESAFVLARS